MRAGVSPCRCTVNRVISLAPNLTEIVFAVGAGDRLVGRTSYCDFPAEAKAVAEVGDTLHPSLERIIALQPQVVLISTASQLEVFTQQLQDQNIAVFVTDPHDLEGVFRSIDQIGEIVGHNEQAELLVQKLRERTHAVEEAVKAETSRYECSIKSRRNHFTQRVATRLSPISFVVRERFPLRLMFRARGPSTATSRRSQQDPKRSFCRPEDRWERQTQPSPKRCANHPPCFKVVSTRSTTIIWRGLVQESIDGLEADGHGTSSGGVQTMITTASGSSEMFVASTARQNRVTLRKTVISCAAAGGRVVALRSC